LYFDKWELTFCLQIVEFYAPWCGHCKNLQPAYEKAAKSLAGLAKVGAVDCDEESNKPFCGGFGVQGFPTLKIIKPGKTPGKPIVEDYNGPRTAKGIVDALVDKIPNYVKKVEDKSLEKWLADSKDTPKAILFTDKGKTSALMKSIAIEFKGALEVAQIRNTDKEKASKELFGIEKFPTLLLLPGGKEAKEGIVYDGELKKEPMVKFLSQAASPNPDPAPPKVKVSKSKDKKKDTKKASKEKADFESASASHASKEGKTAAATATEEVLEEAATESPQPIVEAEKPIVLPEVVPAPTIPTLESETDLVSHCLGDKTGTCILALLPETPDEIASKAIPSLSELAHKYKQHKRSIFPFYAVSSNNPLASKIKESLKLSGNFQIVAINGRRGWWRQISETLTEQDVSEEAIENFVDAIRLGEGSKKKIPEGLIPETPEEAASEEADATVTVEAPAVTETVVVEEIEEIVEEPSAEKPDAHDEL
jgi:protein disulfide-isomerase A6